MFEHLKGLIGASYLRVSSDHQETEHQKRELEAFLKRYGLLVPPANWIIDENWSRTDDDVRPGFQRLLALVRGRAVRFVVTFALDRMAARTPYLTMGYIGEFECNGVELLSVTEAELGNLARSNVASAVMNILKACQAIEELERKASRVVSGLAQHVGNPMGPIPYGYDRGAFGPDRQLKWRMVLEGYQRYSDGRLVHDRKSRGKYPRPVGKPVTVRLWPTGEREEFVGNNSPRIDEGDEWRLIPSVHKDRIEAVRLVYDWWTTEALLTPGDIARRLNDNPGIKPPPTPTGAFYDQFVEDLLGRPIYGYGVQPRFRVSHAKHFEYRGGQVTPVEKLPGERPKQGRRRGRDEWLWPGNLDAYQPYALVPRETWEKSWAKLNDPSWRAAPRIRAKKKSDKRNTTAWLTGVAVCGHCGVAMKPVYPRGEPGYQCRGYSTPKDRRRCQPVCNRNFIYERELQAVVDQWLAQAQERLDVIAQVPTAEALLKAEEFVARHEGYTVSGLLEDGHLYREAALTHEQAVQDYIKTLTKLWREVREEVKKSQKRKDKKKGERVQWTSPDGRGWDAQKLSAAYDEQNQGAMTQVQALLAKEQVKLERMLDNFLEVEPEFRERAKLRIAEQREVVEKLQAQAVPLTQKLSEAKARVERLAGVVAEVRQSLLSNPDQDRQRKAEAVRRVVRQLVTFHEPRAVSGKYPQKRKKPKKGERPKAVVPTRPVGVLVVPVAGEEAQFEVPDRRDVLPAVRLCRSSGTARRGTAPAGRN